MNFNYKHITSYLCLTEQYLCEIYCVLCCPCFFEQYLYVLYTIHLGLLVDCNLCMSVRPSDSSFSISNYTFMKKTYRDILYIKWKSSSSCQLLLIDAFIFWKIQILKKVLAQSRNLKKVLLLYEFHLNSIVLYVKRLT